MKRHRYIQTIRQNKYKKKTNKSTYNKNGNCTYRQDIDFDGTFIDYYFKYDSLERLIYKETHKNNSLYERERYEYHNDTRIIYKITVFNNIYKEYKVSYYDIRSNLYMEEFWLKDRLIVRDYVNKPYGTLYSKQIFISPYHKV